LPEERHEHDADLTSMSRVLVFDGNPAVRTAVETAPRHQRDGNIPASPAFPPLPLQPGIFFNNPIALLSPEVIAIANTLDADWWQGESWERR
jgi:hypothetical protein